MSITTEAMETELLGTLNNTLGLDTIPMRFIKPFAEAIRTHKLILPNLGITDQEIKDYIVLFLNKFPNTQVISLLNNKITDEGVKELLKNETIIDLDLGRNDVSDVGLMALIHHPNIGSLNLLGNPLLTSTGAATLYSYLQETNRYLTLQYAHQSDELRLLLVQNFQYQRLAPGNIHSAFKHSNIDVISTSVVNIIYAYLGLASYNKRKDPDSDSNPIAKITSKKAMTPRLELTPYAIPHACYCGK